MAEMDQATEGVGALSEKIREMQADAEAGKKTNGELREQLEKVNKDLATVSDRLSELTAQRKTAFQESDLDHLAWIGRNEGAFAEMKAMLETRSEDPRVNHVQMEADKLYILGHMLRDPSEGESLRQAIQKTKYYSRLKQRDPIFRKALDTTAAADWIPTEFSANMHERVRLLTKVAQLFDRVDMPTSVYKLPVEGSSAVAYGVTEQGDADAEVTESKKVKATDTLTFPNRQLDARKMGVRIVLSAEMIEESIVPMLNYIRDRRIAKAMAEAQEECVLNGDTAATHMDSDVTLAADRRKLWDGLRKLAISSAKFAATTAGSIDVADIRKLRQKMGVYALTPGECTIVTSILGYNKLLTLKDGSGACPVLTRDKYGDRATLVTGEIAQLDGWPIVLSEFVRSDLNHSGVYDGVTTDATLLMLVNRAQYLFGDYRRPTVKTKEIIDTDQVALVTMQRLDFMSWFPTDPTVGFVYDIRA